MIKASLQAITRASARRVSRTGFATKPNALALGAQARLNRGTKRLQHRSRSAMTSRRNRKSRVLAAQAIGLGLAVPQVLAHRVMRMALAGMSPSRRDHREFYLMGAEKIAVFYESWTAMSAEILRANLEFWLSPGKSFWLRSPVTRRSSRAAAAHFQRAALAVLGEGVAPIHRRAVANAKRLSRRR